MSDGGEQCSKTKMLWSVSSKNVDETSVSTYKGSFLKCFKAPVAVACAEAPVITLKYIYSIRVMSMCIY